MTFSFDNRNRSAHNKEGFQRNPSKSINPNLMKKNYFVFKRLCKDGNFMHTKAIV